MMSQSCCNMRSKKLIFKKDKCEMCSCNKKSALHVHHIIPRRDSRCTELYNNLACICSVCHNEVHAGEVIIIGVYYTTNGRTLMWHRKGTEPMLPEKLWLIKDNPLVITK